MTEKYKNRKKNSWIPASNESRISVTREYAYR
jgi:hypothetical protein